MSKTAPLYRVMFSQDGKIYQVYAKYISEESLMGFIELEEMVFSESTSQVVIDPSEEKLRSEFKDVKRSYIPMHAVLRIDEVQKEGPARIVDLNVKQSKTNAFSQIDYRNKSDES